MLTKCNPGGVFLRNTNKKKGFTLIELLAVIVILAIIALVAVPIILNMISKARKQAAIDSTYGYIEALEYNMGLTDIGANGYNSNIQDGENINIENISSIKVKGKKPEEGTVTIDKRKVTIANLCINGYWVDYEKNEAKIDRPCTPGVKVIKEIDTTQISATLSSITIPYTANEENITVTAEVEDENGDKVTGTVTNGVVTFSGLKAGKTYKYTITARDTSGNETVSKGTVVTANFNNIDINVDDANWTNKKTITITTEENLNGTGTELQYKIGSGSWTKYTEAFEISENTTIYARLKNGENTSNEETLTITKIDTSAPTKASFTHTETDTSITVKASGEDEESKIGYYQFTKDGTTWTDVQTSDTFTFTGLSAGEKVNIKVRVINNTYRNEVNSKNYKESDSEEVTIPKAKHTVTFKNGDTTVETRQVEEDAAIGTLPTNGINVPEGYVLLWYTGANGTGSKITSATLMGTSNVTYYAYVKEANIICKRVTDPTKLHTETCDQTNANYCKGAGYTEGSSKGTTVTYGNAKAKGSALAPGDAFDCKVSTTSGYTERFYYVSGLDGDNTSDTKVLIYSSNVKSGSSNSTAQSLTKWSERDNVYGPITAKTNLPTTSQWNNVSLTSTSRNIVNELGTTKNGRYNISNPFSYEGYAARLLTYQEVVTACGSAKTPETTGYLENCEYLMENTYFTKSSSSTYGFWLETPASGSLSSVTGVYSTNRNINFLSLGLTTYYGTRPAIEVSIDELEY